MRPEASAPRTAGSFKPSRTTTKRFVWANVMAAWGTLWAAIAWAPDALQWLAVPLVMLIVGIFGFYTGTGTADLFAVMREQGRPQPPVWDDLPPHDYRGGVDA